MTRRGRFPVRVIVATLTLALAACGGRTRPVELPDITSETEEGGFQDLVFHVQVQRQSPDGSHLFKAYAFHEGQRVGLEAGLGSGWKPISLGSDLPAAFQGTVELRSLGAESDALMSVMDRLYETKLQPPAMNPATAFSGITLEGDPRDPSLGMVKIKLFFEPGDEGGYAELYLNIDLPTGKLHLDEKDPDYREPLMKALTRSVR